MAMDKRELLNKIQELGFGAVSISKYTGIPDSRIRQWNAGKGLPKLEDFEKLKDLYERFKKNPTNDFVLNEPDAVYKNIYIDKIEILEARLVDKENLIIEKDKRILMLEIEIEKLTQVKNIKPKISKGGASRFA